MDELNLESITGKLIGKILGQLPFISTDGHMVLSQDVRTEAQARELRAMMRGSISAMELMWLTISGKTCRFELTITIVGLEWIDDVTVTIDFRKQA